MKIGFWGWPPIFSTSLLLPSSYPRVRERVERDELEREVEIGRESECMESVCERVG